RRCSVRRKAHDLVFVPVMREPEILGQSLVKDAERVREIHPSFELDIRSAANAPSSAGEIAESVNRDDGRLVKRRHMKRGREVRQVMFDIVELTANTFPGERAFE